MHIYIFSELKLSAISNSEYEAPELQPLCSKVTWGLKSVVIQAHTTLFYGRQLSQSHEWQVNSDQTFLEISLSPWPLIKFLHIHDTKSQHKKTPHTLPDLVPCIHMTWISETQRQIPWDIPELTCLGTSCWSHRTFWKTILGSVRHTELVPVFCPTPCQCMREQIDTSRSKESKVPNIPWIRDDFWNTDFWVSELTYPVDPRIQGLFARQNWTCPHWWWGHMFQKFQPFVLGTCDHTQWNIKSSYS